MTLISEGLCSYYHLYVRLSYRMWWTMHIPPLECDADCILTSSPVFRMHKHDFLLKDISKGTHTNKKREAGGKRERAMVLSKCQNKAENTASILMKLELSVSKQGADIICRLLWFGSKNNWSRCFLEQSWGLLSSWFYILYPDAPFFSPLVFFLSLLCRGESWCQRS